MGVFAMSKEDKYREVHYVKDVVRERIPTFQQSPYHVESLPLMPSEFASQHPEIFKAVFGDELPSAPPFSEAVLRGLANGFSFAEAAEVR